ncbi:MAG: hypothetical protein ACI4RD_08195 [Kiritimatiellia bacterium]
MKKFGALLVAAFAAVAGFPYVSETLPNGDTLLKFTTVGDEVWTPIRDYERVTVLIVGGGGGGGYGCAAGGGGGGEVVVLSNQTCLAGKEYAAVNGDYTLRRRSPCRDQGLRLGWMTEAATDLAGNPRVLKDGKPAVDALPDLGCYENCMAVPGAWLLLR